MSLKKQTNKVWWLSRDRSGFPLSYWWPRRHLEEPKITTLPPSPITGFLTCWLQCIIKTHFYYDRNKTYTDQYYYYTQNALTFFLWIGQVHWSVLAVEYTNWYTRSKVRNLNDCSLGKEGKLSEWLLCAHPIDRMPHTIDFCHPCIKSVICLHFKMKKLC